MQHALEYFMGFVVLANMGFVTEIDISGESSKHVCCRKTY